MYLFDQNPFIEEEQTIQWLKEKVQKDKQRSIKHAYKIKDRVTRTPLKTGCEPRCSGRVNSYNITLWTRIGRRLNIMLGTPRVGGCCFNAKRTMFQQYHDKNKLHFPDPELTRHLFLLLHTRNNKYMYQCYSLLFDLSRGQTHNIPCSRKT